MTAEPARTLDELLQVFPASDDRAAFIGRPATDLSARAFGGHTLAQAFMATSHTVSATQVPVSLHANFLRPASANVASRYAVDTLLAGRSFDSRSVTVSQEGRVMTTATVTWQSPVPASDDYSPSYALPDLPDVQELPYSARGVLTGDLDLRWLDVGDRRGLWFRMRRPVGGPIPNAAVALYVSDLWLLDTALRSVGRRFDDRTVRAGSLDHAAWFHRPIDVSQWCYLESISASVSGGRGLVRASLSSDAGCLLASFAQETVIIPRPG